MIKVSVGPCSRQVLGCQAHLYWTLDLGLGPFFILNPNFLKFEQEIQ
jgi:hypothetical protein